MNICVNEIDLTQSDIDLIIAIWEKEKYNIAIKITSFNYIINESDFIKQLKEKKIPFYFNFNVSNWDELYGMIEIGVSDIFISGELGFNLKRVKQILPENIQIRCYVNICQPSIGDGFKKFFIRPEDIDIYSEYVDVFEFWKSKDKQNVLYEIYFKDKEWNGNLQEIIQGLKVKINNYYILGSEFGRRRSECNRKCIKGQGCQLCDRLVELAESLENSNDFEVFKRRD